MSASKSIYERVLNITKGYFGPCASNILDLQIRSQLHKKPEEITKQDLLQLVDWIQSTVSLLTDDHETIQQCIGRLKRLQT